MGAVTADAITAPLLEGHLREWLGAWPPGGAIDVVGSPARTRPAWDGSVVRVLGVATPEAAVLSVPPSDVATVGDVVGPLRDRGVRQRIVASLGEHSKVLGRGVFRWSTDVAPHDALPDAGEWVDADDARVPDWLRPFNHPQVLIAWDDDGRYGAGVGIKRHDPVGHELAVVTEERLRGRGMGRRLIAQAARRVLADGGLPTYLHGPKNTASARVADAVGFPDRGWSIYSLFDVPS